MALDKEKALYFLLGVGAGIGLAVLLALGEERHWEPVSKFGEREAAREAPRRYGEQGRATTLPGDDEIEVP